MTTSDSDKTLQKLAASTARISWSELELAFAQGKLIYVAPELDLVTTAATVVVDNQQQVKQWQQLGQLSAVSADQASAWSRDDDNLWAVVVAPWVLVQQRVQKH